MDDSHRMAQMRDEEARELLMIRRRERRMAREARLLERRLATFDADEAGAERWLEDEWHREHFGREPDRPPGWWRAWRRAHGGRA